MMKHPHLWHTLHCCWSRPNQAPNDFKCQNCQSYSALAWIFVDHAKWPCAALSSVAFFGIYDVICWLIFIQFSSGPAWSFTWFHVFGLFSMIDDTLPLPWLTIRLSIPMLDYQRVPRNLHLIVLSFQLSCQCHWLDLSSLTSPISGSLNSKRQELTRIFMNTNWRQPTRYGI